MLADSSSNTTDNGISGIGFLTVRHHPEQGFFGGYLLINALARPLEFHCTLPVLPTRAQSILYGRTLPEFICGEQIGLALTKKARTPAQVVFTDSISVLALRRVANLPVIAIELDDAEGDDPAENHRLERPSVLTLPTTRKRIGDLQAVTLNDYSKELDSIARWWSESAGNLSLSEPFARVTQALFEAHPAAKAA
jgi:hypothetical protein